MQGLLVELERNCSSSMYAPGWLSRPVRTATWFAFSSTAWLLDGAQKQQPCGCGFGGGLGPSVGVKSVFGVFVHPPCTGCTHPGGQTRVLQHGWKSIWLAVL